MADPISSTAYAIEAALGQLNSDLALILPTMGLVILVIAIIVANYTQLVSRLLPRRRWGGSCNRASFRRSLGVRAGWSAHRRLRAHHLDQRLLRRGQHRRVPTGAGPIAFGPGLRSPGCGRRHKLVRTLSSQPFRPHGDRLHPREHRRDRRRRGRRTRGIAIGGERASRPARPFGRTVGLPRGDGSGDGDRSAVYGYSAARAARRPRAQTLRSSLPLGHLPDRR